MLSKLTLFVAFGIAPMITAAQAPIDQPLLIGRIALNETHVAFTYAGKIWIVARSGGEAKQLTRTTNEETNPIFSPDGRRIAYSRSNGNDWDVFVANTDGSGDSTRVTMMPEDDFVTSWTADGSEVIFETTRDEESIMRLYRVSVNGSSLATPLPLHQSYQGSMSPDGNRIAYNPRSGPGEWRYYRGGFVAPLWIADLKTGAVEKVTSGPHNDRYPVWSGDSIYFLSDRSGTFNLFAYDTKSKRSRQVTSFGANGVRYFSIRGDTAAYVQDGRIHLFNLLPGGADVPVNFTIAPDTSELAVRNAPATRSLEHLALSPTGDRVVLGARGDVLIFNPTDGSAKNLTNTSAVAERYPTISPDSKSVAYMSDESGEYSLHIRSLETDAVKKIQIESKPSFYWGLSWSPDSKHVTFHDRRLGLWLADVAAGTVAKIDTSSYTAEDTWSPSFSHDSRYIAYAKHLRNRVSTIFVYDVAARKSYQITDGVTHAHLPAFDPNGKYLYFASSHNAGTSDFPWGVLNGMMANPLVFSRLHALVLAKDQPLPLAGNQPNAEAKASDVLPQVRIDFDALPNRFLNLPLPARAYSSITAGRPGKITLVASEWPGAPGDPAARPSETIYTFDIAKGGDAVKIASELDSFEFNADATKLLYRKGPENFLTSATDPIAAGAGKLDLSKTEVRVVPAEEWRQMFRESLRIMRDWFYDPNHHGQNLASLERKYGRYLPTITRRNDLNSLMRQMLGNVSVSHLGVGGGDARSYSNGGNRIGLLGADYEIANGKYRFKKIYRTMPYSSPAGSFGAPLDRPGVDVRDGDYLIDINGQAVDAGKNLLTYFEGAINRPTKITVSSSADGSNPRTYMVFPTGGENRLRRANWAEENRKLVDKLSGGRLGYIFIEGYGGDGIQNAIRGLSGYSDKQGVIIDQRFNGGGITPDYLIEWMQRKPLYYYMFRGGDDIATPVNPAPPVKVMIINELNGSAAETGAFMFKLGKVGQLVGKRTYGGGIGPYYFTPMLIDGGRVQLPGRAAYDPSGTSWGIENVGVAPDHDVEIMPADVIAGRDPQLQKAIEVALAQVAKNPPYSPKRPQFPLHPGEQATTSSASILPEVGSAFAKPGGLPQPPPTPAATEIGATTPMADGKFAAYVGRYDNGPLGVLVIKQIEDMLWAIAPNARPIELTPEIAADRFSAKEAGATIVFERDAKGNVTGIVLTMQDGREVKGKRTP